MMEANLSSVLFLACCFVRAFGDDPFVTTSQGRILGTTMQFRPEGHPEFHGAVDAYLGIPYAEPPVGTLRLRPPVAKSWSGELQATKLGNPCPQSEVNIGKVSLNGSLAEDCLVLDVFVPQQVPSDAGVLVFIHGGGYVFGQGTFMDLLPTPTAVIGDVIVVTMNYRLGALGFLSTDDDVIPGNFGLLDQQLALKWVRDNIQAFGGDPERVAIFGESAGSASVNLQMLSPGSAGLFRGAIMQSGDVFSPWAIIEAAKARKVAFALGKLLGCERDTSEELLECLQKVEDIDYIIKSQQEGLAEEFGTQSILLTPVVDGNFLPGKPAELYAKGAIGDAVSIMGSNADEGMGFFMMIFPNNTDDEAPFINSTTYDALYPVFGSMISMEPIVTDAVKLIYTDPTCTDGPSCNYVEALSQMGGDSLFVCPADKTARAYTQAGRKVYRYFMTHDSTTKMIGPPWSKANHGEDLPFVFGLPLVPSDDFKTTEDEVRMSIQTIRYWSNLAKTGNPNLSSLDAELTVEEIKTEWPLFTVEGLEYKDLTPDMLNGRGIKARECRFWNEFVPQLIKTAEDAKKCKESSSRWTQDGSSDSETCTKDKCSEVPEE
ncbi:cholinesterase 2-like [Asterias rubens]|uniref:cholinesterase 2-like n=1 Tax=Asterias rubens TaxID=7604 RepID=UPI0014557452|nr:cholinesterase 2-like [Asterias rubens]